MEPPNVFCDPLCPVQFYIRAKWDVFLPSDATLVVISDTRDETLYKGEAYQIRYFDLTATLPWQPHVEKWPSCNAANNEIKARISIMSFF